MYLVRYTLGGYTLGERYTLGELVVAKSWAYFFDYDIARPWSPKYLAAHLCWAADKARIIKTGESVTNARKRAYEKLSGVRRASVWPRRLVAT